MALTWEDDRWHCEGKGIHAGSIMELQLDDGSWLEMRIESSNRGKKLYGVKRIAGRDFTTGIEPDYDQLRWPRG